MKRPDPIRLAESFWQEVGHQPDFPRDLVPVLLLHTRAAYVPLARLSLRRVQCWLADRGFPLTLEMKDRLLDGCIVAFDGEAMIFVEETLEENDRRVIVAHELAHYLADYVLPRRRATARLGDGILSILDGQRPAREADLLAASLASVSLQGHVHVMARGFDPRQRRSLGQTERAANELGCELLAPRHTVLARVADLELPEEAPSWAELIRREFGLPDVWAEAYAEHLLRHRPRRSFSDILGL